MRINIATQNDILQELDNKIVTNYWYDDSINPERVFRPSFERINGQGSSNNMNLAASWLSTPQNIIAFSPTVDQTFLDFMKKIGILHNHFRLQFSQLPKFAKMFSMPIYNVDDLPPNWDNLCVNSAATHRFVNTKKNLRALSTFAAPYEVADLRKIKPEDYFNENQPETLYIKLNNTENTGKGVQIARTVEEFTEICQTLLQNAIKYHLSQEIVIQKKIDGINKSFQFLITPEDPETIHLLALSNQIIEADGKSYAGNENLQIKPETISHTLRTVIFDLATRIRLIDPNAFGFTMCDYFELPNGELQTFDPGLRATGNTTTAMAKLFIENITNSPQSFYSELFFVPSDKPNTPFNTYTQDIDHLLNPETAITNGHCVMPWGYNQFQGNGLFISIAKSMADVKAQTQEAKKILTRTTNPCNPFQQKNNT